jgi:hypothetical protein
VLNASAIKWPSHCSANSFQFIYAVRRLLIKVRGKRLIRLVSDFPKPASSHGEIYVAISRVTSREGLKVLALDEFGVPTVEKKIVCREVLGHL